MQDRQKPFFEFQQTAAVEICDKFRYKSFLKPCLYSLWLAFIEFVFKLVVACSFWVARVIKNTLRKPFEFKWPVVRFNRKQTSMTPVPYNKLLTNLASSIRTGEYWPSVVFVRTSLRSVRTSTTSGQYSPVRPSRSVSKRLLLHPNFEIFFLGWIIYEISCTYETYTELYIT